MQNARRRPIFTRCLFLVLLWLLVLPVFAREPATRVIDPSALCENAAWLASRETGVPISVLKAIALNETGRKQGKALRPWPWTVNMEGAGHWFETPQTALSFALKRFNEGARSFDVGCFQLNYKWHGENFASIEQMFDPLVNALYAARFLKTLYAEQGDWSRAAGAYHSRAPERAAAYAARFERFRAAHRAEDLQDMPVLPDLRLAGLEPLHPPEASVPAPPTIRPNLFPLLKPGGGAARGSLVPIGNARGVGLFGPPTTDESALRAAAENG